MGLQRKIKRLFLAWDKCEPVPSCYLHYDQFDDVVKFVSRPVHHYAERLDDTLSVYYCAEGARDVVGCKLDRFSRIIRRLKVTTPTEEIPLDRVLNMLSSHYSAARESRLSQLCDQLQDLARESGAALERSSLRMTK